LAIREELTTAQAVPTLLRRVCHLHEGEESDDEDVVAEAAAGSLSQLLTLDGNGCKELLATMLEPSTSRDLCAVLHKSNYSKQRNRLDQILRCLELVGSQHGVWPETQPELASVLREMLALRSEAAAAFLHSLLSHTGIRPTLCHFGDLRVLQRAVAQLSIPAAKEVVQILDTTHGCSQCGVLSQQSLMACGRCGQVAYCSRECQRLHWRIHKPGCTQR